MQKELKASSSLLAELELLQEELALIVQSNLKLSALAQNQIQFIILIVQYLDEYIPYIDGAIIEAQKSRSISIWRTWLGRCIVQLHNYGWMDEQKRLWPSATQEQIDLDCLIVNWVKFQKALIQRVRMCTNQGNSLNRIHVESPFYPLAYLSLDGLIAMIIRKEKQCLRAINYGKKKSQS